MSIIQLVAQGLQNARYNIPRNLAIEYFTEDFVNDSFVMSRSCDTKLPEYLEIELNSNRQMIENLVKKLNKAEKEALEAKLECENYKKVYAISKF